jgi:hypothetical protein
MTLLVRDIPNSYESAKKLLGKANIRRISKSGCLVKNPYGPDIYIKLYHIVIVRFHPNGIIHLDCGRFPTVTTQHWINRALSKWIDNEYVSNGYVGRETIAVYPYHMKSLRAKVNRLVYYGSQFKYGKVLPVTIHVP